MLRGKDIFKRGFAVFMSMVMVISMMTPWTVLAADEDIQLSLTSESTLVKPGDTIEVELRMSTEVVFDAGTIGVYYDKHKLGDAECTIEDNFNPANITIPIIKESEGYISLALATIPDTYDAFPTGNDMLVATLKFTVLPDVEGDIDFDFNFIDDFANTVTKERFTVAGVDNTNIVSRFDHVPATDITVTPKTLRLQKNGEAQQLTAETTTQTGEPTTDVVVWSSENEKVVTVNEDGLVTPIGAGTTIITATAGEVSDTCEVFVESPLESISLNQKSASILKGQGVDLTVLYTPTDTTVEKNVSWSITDGDATAVEIIPSQDNSSTATIRGLHEGVVTVTATVDGKTASCIVTVTENKLQSIQVTPSSSTIAIGGQKELSVIYNPSNTTDDKAIEWSSLNEEIATVDEDGIVTGKNAGTAIIQAKVGECTNTATVTVSKNHVTVTFPTSANLTYGQTLAEADFVGGSAVDSEGNQVEGNFCFDQEVQSAILTPLNSGSSYHVTFIPTNPNYEAVDDYVPVQIAKKAITVKANDREMNYKETLPSFTYSVPAGELVGSDTKDDLKLILTAYESEGVEVSSSTNVGTYDIVQKSCKSNKYDVTVTPGVLTIHQLKPKCTFPTSAKVTTGHTLAEATFVGGEGNGTFAFEDTTHVVTAEDIGKSYDVIFTPTDSINYETKKHAVLLDVTIPLDSITINPSTATLQPDGTQQLSVIYTPENTTVDRNVTWTSSNESVATVNSEGLVTAKEVGEATITATVAGKTAICQITVVIPTVTDVTIDTGEDELMQNVSAKYTAQVTGLYNPPTEVTWSISGNASKYTTISPDGELSMGVDETAQTIQVMATSVYDTTKSGIKEVKVIQRGDFTHDGIVNTVDKKRLLEAIEESSLLDPDSIKFKEFDLNVDGVIDQKDFEILMVILMLSHG